MKSYNINPLENIVINILVEGKEEVFKSFESIKNPLERIKQRGLYHQALSKIQKGN